VIGTDVIFVSRFAGTLLALYLPLVAARALGHVLRVRGDAIGVEVTDGYLDPILPRAVPAGRAPGLVRDPPPSRRARVR
jgi:hypothetical protein